MCGLQNAASFSYQGAHGHRRFEIKKKKNTQGETLTHSELYVYGSVSKLCL